MNIELLSFLALSFLVAVTPGPSVIYVVSYSLRYGSKAGIISTLGINSGSVVAILIAAYGLSSLLAAYPNAISFIQLIGGFYVIYLATLMWPRDSIVHSDEWSLKEESYRNLFKNGFITSVLNPKDILFYTAFIPTFISQDVAGKKYQTHFLLLAFAYMSIGFITKCLFAVFSGYTKNALNSKKANLVNYFSSTLLLILGAFLVVKAIGILLEQNMNQGSFG